MTRTARHGAIGAAITVFLGLAVPAVEGQLIRSSIPGRRIQTGFDLEILPIAFPPGYLPGRIAASPDGLSVVVSSDCSPTCSISLFGLDGAVLGTSSLLDDPDGVAFDALGQIYVGGFHRVVRADSILGGTDLILAENQFISNCIPGLDGVTVTPDGSTVYAISSCGNIWSISGGGVSLLGTPFGNGDVRWDPSTGLLLLTGESAVTGVYTFDPATGLIVDSWSTDNASTAIAAPAGGSFGSNHQIFASQYVLDEVARIDRLTGTVTPFATGIDFPSGMDFAGLHSLLINEAGSRILRAYPAPIPGETGAIVHYRFDGILGQTPSTIVDLSGNDNHGAVVGNPVFVPGMCSGETALDFSSDHVGVTAIDELWTLPNSGSVTVEALVRPADTGYYFIVSNWPGGTGFQFAMDAFQGEFGITFSNGVGGQNDQVRAGAVVPGEWVHVAGVRDQDAGEVRMYRNAQLVGSAPLQYSLADAYSAFAVGARFDGTIPFDGEIAEVRVTGSALSPADFLGGGNLWYLDADSDGFGDPASTPVLSCTPLPGRVANSDDCDDSSDEVYPGAPELADGVDNDCDGRIDEDVVLEQFIRGDGNGDGAHDIADAVFTLAYLFSGGPGPCRDAQDWNDDGALDIGDAIYGLSFLFAGGAGPPPPVGACGPDPTADAIDCANYSCP